MSFRRSTQFFPSSACRFCKENGHEVKNCTKLANSECRYCKNFGHTISRCPTIAAKEQRRRSQARLARAARRSPDEDGFSKPKSSFRRRVNKDVSNVQMNILSNFAAFNSDDEDEPVQQTPVTTNCPTFVQPRTVTGCWSKPLTIKEASIAAQEEKRAETPKKAPKKIRWADMCDDEDSDSDDEDLFLGSY